MSSIVSLEVETRETHSKVEHVVTPRHEVRKFFIVGCPRSGTTLLQAILNREPRIMISPETKLFCLFHRQARYIRRRQLGRIQKNLDISVSHSFDCSTLEILEQIQSRLLEKSGRQGIQLFGEKTPEHTSRIKWIRECYPEAPILAIVRDGRAVANSLTQVPWLRCNHLAGCMIWNHYMGHLTSALDSGCKNLHIVRYEDLIANPLETISRLLCALGLDNANIKTCLQPSPVRDAELFPVHESTWKRKAVEPLESSTFDFEKLLSRSQLRKMEIICRPMLLRWRYLEPTRKRANTFRVYCVTAEAALSMVHTATHLPSDTLASEFSYRWLSVWDTLFCRVNASNVK